MKKYLNILSKIGLHEKESKIYLTLLDHGESSISEIAKYAHLTRAEVYRFLPHLLETSLLLQHIIGKRKYYSAWSPKILQELLHNTLKESDAMIENLSSHFDEKKKISQVITRTGSNGITQVFADIVETCEVGECVYRITSEKDVAKTNAYMPDDYRKIRAKKWLQLSLITSEQVAKKKNPRLDREMAIIPEKWNEFDNNISLTLYGNKMAYIDFNTESSVMIENEQMADFQKKIFRLLFRYLSKGK